MCNILMLKRIITLETIVDTSGKITCQMYSHIYWQMFTLIFRKYESLQMALWCQIRSPIFVEYTLCDCVYIGNINLQAIYSPSVADHVTQT
jgi:hypothetical protein